MTETTQDQVNRTAWAACDTFRGVVDAGQYKDYILAMLFLKYISDLWDERVETCRRRYGDNEARIRRRLARERFVLPASARFRTLYEQRGEPNIGELINMALEAVEDANRAKLEGVFRSIDFNSEANHGRRENSHSCIEPAFFPHAHGRITLTILPFPSTTVTGPSTTLHASASAGQSAPAESAAPLPTSLCANKGSV